MDASPLPQIRVRGPDGQSFDVELTKDRLTIGRLQNYNDLALQPDLQKWISRVAHCIVEYESGSWWVTHNGSVNPISLQHDQAVAIVRGRAVLADGDVIRILANLTESSEATYWELTFQDPLHTRPAPMTPRSSSLEYDWIQAKLFRVDGPNRVEIPHLRPQEHKLVRYMDQRNRANGGVPVMCTYEELVAAVWGEGDEAYGRTDADVQRLALDLRRKIEPDPGNSQFLQTVQGLGYRLVTRPLSR